MENPKLRPFHLAFPVRDLEETELWYTSILGCTTGRKSNKWIDFNFFGHQIVAHLTSNVDNPEINEVDGNDVPSKHFGIILIPKDWKKLADDLEIKKVDFKIKPHTRFKNKPGEQHTLFIKDPSGNFLEFKSFEDDNHIFKP